MNNINANKAYIEDLKNKNKVIKKAIVELKRDRRLFMKQEKKEAKLAKKEANKKETVHTEELSLDALLEM